MGSLPQDLGQEKDTEQAHALGTCGAENNEEGESGLEKAGEAAGEGWARPGGPGEGTAPSSSCQANLPLRTSRSGPHQPPVLAGMEAGLAVEGEAGQMSVPASGVGRGGGEAVL